MSILPLVQLKKSEISQKESPLRKPCEEVKDFGPEFQKVVDDLIENFMNHKIAIGLSAPQIGIQLKVSVISLNKDKQKAEDMLIIVNPKILSISGKKDKKKETCMSLPNYTGEVERRHKISISYQNRNGEEKRIEAEGFLARVIAHETDHLEGLLYVDRMKDSSKLEPTDIFAYD